jgi:hypothetical protein
LAVVEFQVQIKKRSDPTTLVHDLEALGEPQIRRVAVGADGGSPAEGNLG